MQAVLEMPRPPRVQDSHREHPRVLFSVPITLRHLIAGIGLRSAHGISLDISGGGLGAIVQGRLRVGEHVQIDLPTASRTLRTSAIVRHTSDMRSGFEFLGLTEEERFQIASLTGSA